MNSWDQCTAVARDPAKVSGAWVFAKTRVPVRALFENLEDGAAVNFASAVRARGLLIPAHEYLYFLAALLAGIFAQRHRFQLPSRGMQFP